MSIPGRQLMVTTVDYHTAGEPFRIVSHGVPALRGGTIMEKRRYALEHVDHIRQLFNSTQGKHPIFTPPSANDFHAASALANDANADRQSAYSLLLDKGDVLVRRNFDANAADFTIAAVIDPSLPASLHTISVDDDGRIVRTGTVASVRAIPTFPWQG